MKVVFLETVEGSGSRGEVKTVAGGYARNYLLPRGLAAPATPTLLRRAETLAKEEKDRQRLLDEQAQGRVGMLQGQRLVMPMRVGEQGRLYGSVTDGDVAEKAGEILGEELDRRRILLPKAIRQVGVYTVPIRMSRNVTADAEVVVVDVEAPGRRRRRSRGRRSACARGGGGSHGGRSGDSSRGDGRRGRAGAGQTTPPRPGLRPRPRELPMDRGRQAPCLGMHPRMTGPTAIRTSPPRPSRRRQSPRSLRPLRNPRGQR